MEKLTEKINSFNISKNTKNNILLIAEREQIQIQQVCRRLLNIAVEHYFSINKILKDN
jgi:hypothetical protein